MMGALHAQIQAYTQEHLLEFDVFLVTHDGDKTYDFNKNKNDGQIICWHFLQKSSEWTSATNQEILYSKDTGCKKGNPKVEFVVPPARSPFELSSLLYVFPVLLALNAGFLASKLKSFSQLYSGVKVTFSQCGCSKNTQSTHKISSQSSIESHQNARQSQQSSHTVFN